MNEANWGSQPLVRRIEELTVSAIVRTDDWELASDAMAAAVEGGFRMVEFTLTTPRALELIADFAEREDLLVGAGTVMTPEEGAAAVDAGARFLVSPVFDPDVVVEARRLRVPCIPGTFTATEMAAAWKAGAEFVKLFPAPANLPAYVSALRGPLPQLRIFPTSGVTPENFIDVLHAGASGVGFVKPLFAPEDLAVGNLAAIRHRAELIHERLAEWRSTSEV